MINAYLHKPMMQFNVIDAVILYAVVILVVLIARKFL